MLQNIKELYGKKLAASDGEIGHVKDFFFDDKTWVIRYLIVDTGTWLADRLVLISPHVFGNFNREEKILSVNLTRKQIENSPSIDSKKSVSRQYEVEYYNYYKWPTYWGGTAMWGACDFPVVLPPPIENMKSYQQYIHRDDNHLRSVRAMTGYHVQTFDGSIGSVSGLMVDDKSWAVGNLVVETGHWYSNKEIMISTRKVEKISYEESKVYVNLKLNDIRQTSDKNLVTASS